MTAIFSSKPMRAAIAPALLAVFSAAAHAQVSVVNAASFRVGNPVAPGGLASAFLGSPLAVETTVAPDLPLPTTLAGVRLLVNDVPAPLIFVSAGQINFQIPSGVPIGEEVAVQVVVDGGVSQSGALTAAAADPGIIYNPKTENQEAVALHGADNSLVSSANPAARGEVIVLYAVGPGATDPPVPDGTAAGGNPVSRVTGETKVFFGGVEAAEVLFSGLAPGSVGLWQINVRMPQDAGLSGEIELRITLDGIRSNTTALRMAPAAPPAGEEDCSGLLSMAPTESPLRLGCFVPIPPGEFTMGSESAEAQADEKPLTRVRISRGFQMGKYEVTKEEWLLIAGPSPYADPDCNVGCPADNMTWDELQSDFLMRLNERDPAFYLPAADGGGMGVRGAGGHERRPLRRCGRSRLAQRQQQRGDEARGAEAAERLGAVRHAGKRVRVGPGHLRSPRSFSPGRRGDGPDRPRVGRPPRPPGRKLHARRRGEPRAGPRRVQPRAAPLGFGFPPGADAKIENSLPGGRRLQWKIAAHLRSRGRSEADAAETPQKVESEHCRAGRAGFSGGRRVSAFSPEY